MAAHHLTEESSENLKTIQHEAQRLADMVTNLMEYSYGHPFDQVFGLVDVNALFESVEAISAPLCLKNGNKIRIEPPENMIVWSNEETLLQIFINLVVNANRHTSNGVICVLAETDASDRAIFHVQDNGGGIDPEVLPHVFDKGVSGDGGSGLGLAICKEAVEAQGGVIRIERTGPDGTDIAFTVPLNGGKP